MKKINLENKKVGQLTVLYDAARTWPGKKRVLWMCKCVCSNEKLVISDSLLSGKTRSCGCLQNEIASNIRKIDLVGRRFGNLMVLSESYTNEHRKVFWLCVCDCGGNVVVRGNDLNSGKTKSCGSPHHRSGENNPNYKDGRSSDMKKYRHNHYMANKSMYYAKSSHRRALKLSQIHVDVDLKYINSIYKIASDMNNRAAGRALFHVDHIIPLSKGGLHHQDNLQILLAEDNLSKGTKILEKEGFYYGKEDSA